MGGRVAEEQIFGTDKVTTGASSDIKYATEIARRMVTEWGLSEKMGPITYGSPQQELFLGHSVTQTQTMSEATAQTVDQEVRRIVDEAYQTARKILTKHTTQLEDLAQALIEFETLTGEDINNLLAGKKIKPVAQQKPRKIHQTSLPILEEVSPKSKLQTIKKKLMKLSKPKKTPKEES